MKRVRVKADAPHVPAHHRGDEADVLEEKRLSFGRWYRVRFADGCELWTIRDRVSPVGGEEAP